MSSTAPTKRHYGPVPPKPSAKSPQGGLLDDYLLEDDAAAALGVRLKTLQEYRKNKVGPAYAVVARRVLYSRDSLKAWLAAGGSKDA